MIFLVSKKKGLFKTFSFESTDLWEIPSSLSTTRIKIQCILYPFFRSFAWATAWHFEPGLLKKCRPP